MSSRFGVKGWILLVGVSLVAPGLVRAAELEYFSCMSVERLQGERVRARFLLENFARDERVALHLAPGQRERIEREGRFAGPVLVTPSRGPVSVLNSQTRVAFASTRWGQKILRLAGEETGVSRVTIQIYENEQYRSGELTLEDLSRGVRSDGQPLGPWSRVRLRCVHRPEEETPALEPEPATGKAGTMEPLPVSRGRLKRLGFG